MKFGKCHPDSGKYAFNGLVSAFNAGAMTNEGGKEADSRKYAFSILEGAGSAGAPTNVVRR